MTQRERRQAREREGRQAARERGMDAMGGGALVEWLADAEGAVAGAAADTLVARGGASVPALIGGLAHRDGKVRAACALLLDHVADDRCVEPLLRAVRTDPREAVRRCALHALVCDGCKGCPLSVDVTAVLAEVARRDRSRAVRRRAVFYLSQQRPDPRAVSALQALLSEETDAVLLRRARAALGRHQSVATVRTT